jgi:hypothetical protein
VASTRSSLVSVGRLGDGGGKLGEDWDQAQSLRIDIVELDGIEPTTSGLQSPRSPN